MNDLPKAVWEGRFTLGGMSLRCYVLENGQRIVNADDLKEFNRLFAARKLSFTDKTDFDKFLLWSKGL